MEHIIKSFHGDISIELQLYVMEIIRDLFINAKASVKQNIETGDFIVVGLNEKQFSELLNHINYSNN